MKSKANPHVDPQYTTDDPLGDLLELGNNTIKSIFPDWNPPNLTHPHAVQYESVIELIPNIVPGDQIMVTSGIGRTAYWHHGIYIGEKNNHGVKTLNVVDAWGNYKPQATISIRKLRDFADGAKGFAKAQYPTGTALPHEMSVKVVLALVDIAKQHGFVYDAAKCNCEHMATFCRILRCDDDAVCALNNQLESLHIKPLPQILTRFKRTSFFMGSVY